jgi:integrase
MAKVRLTDKYVAAITAPAGTRLEVFDQHPQGAGLMLRVTPAGLKAWMVRYRTDDGQQRRFSLGLYPDVTLTDARNRASVARGQARDGKDPAAAKRRRKAEAKAQPIKTLLDLSETYFTACENGEWKPRGKKKRASTLAGENWLWKRHIKPDLGDLRIEDVTPAAVKKLLRALVAKGHEVTSNRVRGQIRQMFNFAIAEGRVAINPVASVKALGAETPRQRVLRDEELKAVWAALTDPSKLRKLPAEGEAEGERVYVSEPVAIAIKLLALTLTRRAEVAGMARDELDLAQGSWVIPGARTKNGLPHLVPLAPEAVVLIKRAIALADEDRERNSPLVFPSPRNREVANMPPRSIGPSALSHALRDVRVALELVRLSPHDLRRTAATNMASERLGVSPFLIGRLLNHTSETGGAAMVTMTTYARHDYAAEKRAALVAWADLLLEMVGEKIRPSNVKPMRKGTA